jgi:transcriptional regulator of acetoin/glycerol metabolism
MAVTIDPMIPFKQAKSRWVAEFERRYLSDLMKEHEGNVSRAARSAGLDRMTVHKMLNRSGLER